MASGSWLTLTADRSDEQVGLFVTALAAQVEVAAPPGRDEVVEALLAEEFLIVAGGLQVGDSSTGAVVLPGCCAGLEDWRDWAHVLTGGSPWLGHDPSPEVEVVGADLRVWQDGGSYRHRGPWGGCRVDLPYRALPELLAGVQRDLVGFHNLLAGWAQRVGLGRRGAELVTAVDQSFAITAPWDTDLFTEPPTAAQ